MPQLFNRARKAASRPLTWFKKTRRRNKVLAIIGLIVLFFIVSSVVFPKDPTKGYSFATVERKNIVDIVSESGNITTGGNTLIYSPTNGVIAELYVSNGDLVIEGQELFTVKSTATDQEQQAAYAAYLTAKSTLNSAQSTANTLRADMYTKWETFRNMAKNGPYENGDGSPNDVERLSTEFQVAQDNWQASEKKYKDQQTAISQAQAQVSSTWLLYQATQNATVKSPIRGTIANLAVTPGSTVSIQSPTLLGPAVLSVADFTTIEALLSLSEQDTSKVKPGQEVSLDVNAVDNKVYEGRVSRVDEIGTVTQGVVKYNTYISVINPDSTLKAGMTVDADITTDRKDDVLSVPNSAIKPYKGGRAVRVLDSKTKKVTYIPVTIGLRGVDRTEIVKGIDEGTQVILALPNDQLKRSGLF